MGPELKLPADTNVNLQPAYPPVDPPVLPPHLHADKHHFPLPHRKFHRRCPDLHYLSRDLLALCRYIRRHATHRLSHMSPLPWRPGGRVTQSLVVLCGIVLSLLLSLFATALAFHANVEFVARAGGVAGGVPPPVVSGYTASKLSASLADIANGPYVERALARNFDFPPSLSRKISLHQRYSLLTQLQDIDEPRRLYPLRLFILHVVGSHAAGRLAAVASAITYARNTHRFLLVLWDTGRGGEAFGTEPVRALAACEKDRIMFTMVDSLQLSPNLSSWSEFQINYYTKNGTGGYSLDSVAALATRHIFYRSEVAIDARYAELSPGIMRMERLFAPGSSIERAWSNFIKEWTFPGLDIGAVGDLLHRVYGVPLIFLDALSSDNKRKLLRGLSRSTSKRAFFVHAQYGLGNRLRALGSAMAVAKVTGRVLVLIWEPDVHLDCRFSDLFSNDLIVMDKLNMNWPPGDANTKDQAMRTVDFYNFMRFQGKHIHNPLKQLVNPRSGRHVYVKTAYVVRSSFAPRIISTTSAYWKVMRETLVANAEIMYLVHDPSFVNIRGMVGVHIRSRTIENDIKGVSEEFYGNGSQTTDHWRRLTGLKTFENKIMRLSLRYKFFVAADTREAITLLEKKFGSHRIFSLPRDEDCMTRDVECAKLALADILLLSKVPTLLGSNWSSFTEGAVRLSGHVRVLLAGVHFGRKQG